ncbi:MAG TPA: hypothetical protein VEK15_03910 [Vicinamibacteria bacterium]|nr:hypothetical protein [Vicinamibacteria bacterium]
MDLQSQIRVYNEALGVKGAKGKLLQIHATGYYEIALEVKERYFQALVPINSTVLLSAEPVVETETIPVERY